MVLKFYLDMKIAIYMQCHFKYQDVCCLRNVNCIQISKEIKNREQFILKSDPRNMFLLFIIIRINIKLYYFDKLVKSKIEPQNNTDKFHFTYIN